MGGNSNIWRIKLVAWTHDPAEKALILMRGPDPHEEAVKDLRQVLHLDAVPQKELELAIRADHWASALDRPQHPQELGHWPPEVHFWKEPELVHPLAGDRYRLSELWEDSREWIELTTFVHLLKLLNEVHPNHEEPLSDEKAFLALWRLAPEKGPTQLKLGHLWRLLPADSRVPDHSIWEHLALTSAIATSFATGDVPALLHVSLGPVQSFIEQARTLSDFWAGSHLLSYLAWHAIKPIAEAFGPDVVIYPSLWGVPLVDVWLQNEKGIPLELPWWEMQSDANPLFRAALPNVFVALVPEKEGNAVLQRVQASVAKALDEIVQAMVQRLLEDAGEPLSEEKTDYLAVQVKEHLEGFPELKYALVPFSPLTDGGDSIKPEGYQRLKELIGKFRESQEGKPSSFLDHPFWKVLEDKLEKKDSRSPGEWAISDTNTAFSVRYQPNPGSLYPALRELADDYLAMAKSVRDFNPQVHEGFRCDLCGERQWLSLPEEEHTRGVPPGRRRSANKTIWLRLEDKPIWGRKGEHLCGRCALKRFWPAYFAEQVTRWQGGEEAGRRVHRFVVSTHTMALARDLQALVEQWSKLDSEQKRAWEAIVQATEGVSPVALPRSLAVELQGKGEVGSLVRRLPALLEEREGEKPSERQREILRQMTSLLGRSPERYYALILMDGDRMGQWVSGDPEVMIPLKKCWHSKLANYVQGLQGGLDLLKCPRPGSASHHQALSGALNTFALQVAPWVVEELFLGRLIYCGGDDLLAMVSVDDLLPCMFMLRCAFSGIFPAGDRNAVWSLYEQLKAIQDEMGAEGDVIARGYVRKGKSSILRVMGGRATASMGAVVAHHMSPLSSVLRQLRAAEKAAKSNGRNSFSIRILKRAGGALSFTARWGFGGINGSGPDVPYDPENFKSYSARERSPMSALFELRDALAIPGVSRRAVYNAVVWLNGMPPNPEAGKLEPEEYQRMLEDLLAYQFKRQGMRPETFRKAGIHWEANEDPATRIAHTLVNVALGQCRPHTEVDGWRSVTEHLSHMLQVAEFLAREGRALGNSGKGGGQ